MYFNGAAMGEHARWDTIHGGRQGGSRFPYRKARPGLPSAPVAAAHSLLLTAAAPVTTILIVRLNCCVADWPLRR